MTPRVMFASYHCHHDPASGAAICTRDLFRPLAARGWTCGSFTGPRLDNPHANVANHILTQPNWSHTAGRSAGINFTVYHQHGSGYRSSVFVPESSSPNRLPTPSETATFLAVFREAVTTFRPEIVLTYGGDSASQGVIPIAKQTGAKVVFWLHNFAYTSANAFRGCDAVIVPSQCSRDYYRTTLDITCQVLPPVIDPMQVVATDRTPKYIVFVNPEPVKGVLWFARIAEVLGRTRPDIPLLVVEGRGQVDWLGRCGVDLAGITSVHRMKNTLDPRRFYRLAKLVLMPSVWRESFGRVAAESLLNGIPVLTSDRGALPEVTGDTGLSLPEWLTPATRTPPRVEDVSAWTQAIVRLWDNADEYDRACRSAREAGRRWHSEVVVPMWERVLNAI